MRRYGGTLSTMGGLTSRSSRRPLAAAERQGVRQTREGVESGFHTRDI
jgi:hypothetical protein